MNTRPTLSVAYPDNPMGTTTRPRLRKSVAQYAMIEFVRPDSYWPNPYSIEQAFGVLQDAIARSQDVGIQGRWGFYGVGDLLLGRGTVNHKGASITSINNLREVFHRLVMGRSNAPIENWRNENGLDVAGTFRTAFPHYKPFAGTPFQGQHRASEATIKTALTWLLEANRGKLLAVSLNSVHLVARTVGNVMIDISASGITFILEFTYDDSPGSSHWFETLAHGSKGEPFSATLDRAIDRMKLLMGDGYEDNETLCAALNQSENNQNTNNCLQRQARFYVLGNRPVKQWVWADNNSAPTPPVTQSV